MATEKGYFAAGCFWGVEATFRRIDGVLDAVSGYAGGTTQNPTYEQVCSGTTGHTETVEVTYDPAKVSYDDLLSAFFDLHDPTQVDRQGPDIGTQYRSAIFTTSPAQAAAAEAAKARLDASGQFPRPIATQIAAAGPFWRAEEYHQRYEEKRAISGRGLRGWL